MATCVFGWQNAAKSAAIVSYNSAQPGLDPTQWQTNDAGAASMAWQTVGTTATVLLDAGSTGQTWGAVALSRTNLSAGAQWSVTIWADAGQTTVVYGGGAATAANVTGGQCVLILPAQVAGQRISISVTDTANPEGFLNIPLAYAGPLFRPAGNISWQTTRARDRQVDEVVTRSGTEFPQFRWSRRRWSLDMQSLRTAELPTWQSIDQLAALGGNILFVPDPASATINADAIFGRLTSKADITYPFGCGDRLAWKADATERL